MPRKQNVDLAAYWKAGFDDPAFFARYFLKVEPYPAQEKVLRETRDLPEANITAGNRAGKSWLCGVMLLWRVFYRYTPPGEGIDQPSDQIPYRAIVTSLTTDQAKIAFTYAWNMAKKSWLRKFIVHEVSTPFPELRFRVPSSSGWAESELWARSLSKPEYLLGHSAGFVLVDECAFVPDYRRIEDEVLRMRLADLGGALFRVSTPNGMNFFYSYFAEGEKKGYSFRISTLDNPHISRAYLEKLKGDYPPEYWRANVLAEFVSPSDFFPTKTIENAYAGVDYSLPLQPGDKPVVIGADLGAALDPTVVCILEVGPPAKIVFLGELRSGQWQAVRKYVLSLYERYRPVGGCVDATGIGAPVAQQLVEEDGLTLERFVFSLASKPALLVTLQEAFFKNDIVFPYTKETRDLVNQLSFYRLDDKNIAQDYVIALALAYRACLRARKTQTSIAEFTPPVVVVRDTNKGAKKRRIVPPADVAGWSDDLTDDENEDEDDYDSSYGILL